MTIDQRLDRLTERHEALTQTVELLVHEFRAHEETMAKNHEKNQVLMAQVLEGINGLARIAQSHEQGIARLESKPS